jgi:8-oxo-dGTP pyrophosphatase MutT (NUDIX family)
MTRPVQEDGHVHGAIVGCRRADGRWLLIRRAARTRLAPLKVCFPGGAVEVGEHHRDAAAREFEEEMGVKVNLVRLVWQHTFEDRRLTLWGYLGELEADQTLTPNPREVEEALWLTAEEVADHCDGLPRTADFVASLEAAARQR